MSKRIVFTVTNDLVYDRRMHRICVTLQTNGYAVELVGRLLKDSKPLQQFSFKQTRLSCFFNKGFLFYVEYNIRLFIFLLFRNFTIVCGCDLDTLPAAMLAAKLKRKKVVYDAHEYFPESPELIGKPFKQSVWYFIEKFTVPYVDALYTVTNSIAELFKKKYNVDCAVVRNLPPLKKNKRTNDTSSVLLYQGAVNIGRGLNEMLLTMLKIDDLEFHIAGDGDEMKHIRYSIEKLNLSKRVKLLGKKSPNELEEITQKAFIGINLLENRGLSYYYSLGNKTFDYIQAGIPQVLIGFPEYIALNKEYNIGLIVDELTVEKIEIAIRKLQKDKALYEQLQQNCFKAREVLCWEKEEQKLVAIYSSLINSKI